MHVGLEIEERVVLPVGESTQRSERRPLPKPLVDEEPLAEELYDLVDNRAIRKLVLDFSKVKFLSSSALGVLITLRKKADEIKGKVVMCSMKPEIRKIFKITNLEKLFDFYENEERALNYFGVSTMG